MRVSFLHASDNTRLSKSYEEIAPGQYKEETYPHVLKFDSLDYEADSLDAFYALLLAASENGLCLIKGKIKNKLENDSRAGQTDSHEKTEWICLDIDYEVTDQTPEQFIDALSTELKDCSFIFQKSASTGIKTSSGWRGHFFILLSEPHAPQVLKQWLTGLNLKHTELRKHMALSASGSALKYPLDTTTCQNDKLIYVAEPTCTNFPNPVAERFVVCNRTVPSVKITASVSASEIQKATVAVVKELRATSQLETKSFKTKKHTDGQYIILNPDPMTISEVKEARGFVYLNINGGNSWAYYFPIANPEIIWNFKGEPAFYLKDVDPELYAQYSGAQPAESSDSITPLVFRWRTDDMYYNGFYNATSGELICINSTNSKNKLKDFLVQHGVLPDKQWVVPDWELEFDPTTQTGKVDFAAQKVNVYAMPQLAAAAEATDLGIPPTIKTVLNSVCVTEEVQDYFLNWLAYIFQTRRKKTGTSWIFQGVEGTGKGVLFSHIISPLLGREYCNEITMDRFDDQFNSYLERNIILFIDEANIADNGRSDRTVNKLKNLITEELQLIRRMRSNPILVRNFTNVILASNHDEIMSLSVTDRRFNVAPRQETPLLLDYQDIAAIEQELPHFANHLKARKINEAIIKRVLMTDAREKLIELSKTSLDHFFHAVVEGDLEYFVQFTKGSAAEDDYIKYQMVMDQWTSNIGVPSKVTREDLRICYQYIQQSRIAPAKFSRICAKYHLDIKNVRINDKVVKGIDGVVWKLDDALISMYQPEKKSAKVVGIK